MNSDKLGLKKEFLNLYLHAVLAHFTAIVVFILGSKHIVNSYDKLPDFIPLISSYYFNIIMLLMGVFFFFYMLFEVYLKRMIQILNAAKFSAPFYYFFYFLVLLGWEFFHFSALFPQLVLCKIIFLIYKSE